MPNSRHYLLPLLCLLACGSDGEEALDDSGATESSSPTSSSDSATATTVGMSASSSGSSGNDSSSSPSEPATTDNATSTGSDESSDEDSSGGEPPPGEYEGYGAVTEGADSCPDDPDEVHVTTLEDSGPGSLREALSDGCRRIVFDLGGTITLASDLNIPYSYITVDGSTAPSPGITILQPGTIGTTLEARNSIGPVHDVIIHNLRMDGMAESQSDEGDIWGMDGEANEVFNVVIDHVTASRATDGVFDIWENVHDVTLSWNFVTDTVAAQHFSTGTDGVTRERISLHHTVFAGNNERQIRVRHENNDIDYRNNVVYGWGYFEGGAAGLHLAYDDGEPNPSLNVVGNVFHFVAGLAGSEDDALKFERGPSEGQVFFEDNIFPALEADAVSTGDELPVPAAAQVTLYDASSLATTVVPFVGTHFPTREEAARLVEIAGAL